MLQQTSRQIRRTVLCAATAFALCLPGIAAAGPLGKSKNKAAGAVVHATKIVKKAAKPVAKAVKKGSGQGPVAELLDIVQELNLTEQLRETIALMQQMDSDYGRFSGGSFGCKGECKAFRARLKATFEEFLLLIEDVPVLNDEPGLYENVARFADIIDFVPPRALYLMWQALDDQIDELQAASGKIRDLLANLPPLEPVTGIAAYVDSAATYATDSPICKWSGKKNKFYVEWVQAELEAVAWGLQTIDGLIPDLEITAKVGVKTGAAVANGIGAALAAMKPTDVAKIALKVVAAVPESINWAITLNVLRAEVVCKTAQLAAK